MFTNDGLYDFGESFYNSVTDNLVDGRLVVYLEGVSNRSVSDAGQVVLVNCSNAR